MVKLYKFIVVFLIIITFQLLTTHYLIFAEDINNLLNSAESLWSQRDDLKNSEQAIELFKKVIKLDPQNEQALVGLSKTYSWIADNLSNKENEKKLKYFKIGIDSGEMAIQINPRSVGGNFWCAVNTARYAESSGIFNTVLLYNKFKKMMMVVYEEDPTYSHGGVYSFLSQNIYKMPKYIRILLGYKINEAISLANKAIEVEPHCFYNHRILAEVYLTSGKKKEAIEELQWIINTTPDILPEDLAPNKLQQRIAKDMLNKITKEDN